MTRPSHRTPVRRAVRPGHVAVLPLGDRRQPQRRPDSAPQEGARPQRFPIVAHPDGVLRRLLPDGASRRLADAAARLSPRHPGGTVAVRAGHAALPAGGRVALVSVVPARAVRDGVRPMRARGGGEPVRHGAGATRERRAPAQHGAGVQRAGRRDHADPRRALHPVGCRASRGGPRRHVARGHRSVANRRGGGREGTVSRHHEPSSCWSVC